MARETLRKLIGLVARLRGPDGCAWDRAQSYDSMKGLLLEEAYEVIDAINQRDFDGLEDELGDLLFQIVFYAQLAEEEGRFTLDRVIEGLHAKLVRRHPHVFGKTPAHTPEEALRSWLSVKEQEQQEARSRKPGARSKKQRARTQKEEVGRVTSNAPPNWPRDEPSSLLDGIPPALPATLEAYELGVRAAEVGFDWGKIEDLLNKVAEEVAELRGELGKDPTWSFSRRDMVVPPVPATGKMAVPGLEEEVGDLLFAACNLARHIGSDPESCLRRGSQKFKSRFRALEREAAGLGKRVRDCTPQELDRLWNIVKEKARRQESEGTSFTTHEPE